IVMADGRSPADLSRYCREQCGVVLGRGIGDLGGRAFRIAHMGYVNAPMVLGTLGAVEMGLAALGVPHRRGGVQAAVDYMAEAVPADMVPA
ncbi:MAG TPA: aminotransferase, partial [Afifellaceae bacterium]|nr:aminotransferase [Afifellaceae bacterium]